MTQAVVAHMPSGSSIINLTSGAGRKGNPVSAMYAASKAAVISVTQSAAAAFAENGVRVNGLAPGRVDSAMWSKVVELQAELKGEPVSSIRDTERTGTLLGRLATPSDIVGPAIFLARALSEQVHQLVST